MAAVRIEQPSFSGGLDDTLRPYTTPASLDDLTSPPYTDPIFSEIDLRLRTTASRFGSVYGYTQEQNGAIIQNLFPIKKNETTQISSSSKVTLEMHTETAFHRYMPSTVLLFCMRGDPQAGTNIATLDDILPNLDISTKRALKQPEFITEIDESFRSDEYTVQPLQMSVLNDSETKLTYDRALMVGTTGRAQRALDTLSHVIDGVMNTITLQTGDLLIIDNKRAVHGRTPFQARYDGTDRWLKRVLVTTQHIPSEHVEYREGRDRVVTLTF